VGVSEGVWELVRVCGSLRESVGVNETDSGS
jgi:hypothetical protein